MKNSATDSTQPVSRYRHIWTILAICMVMIFIALAIGVQSGSLDDWDNSILRSMINLHTSVVTEMFKAITYTASEIVMVTLAFATLLLWRLGHKREMVLLLFSWALFNLIANGLKQVFQRPRPDIFDYLVNQSGYSFPSGHTAAAISLFGLLGVFLWRPQQRGYAMICWFWVILVAFSRVYLGVHYPSDVLASLSLGIAWLIVIVSNADRITGLFFKDTA